jgi:quinol monooxygenase YgiN
MSSPLVYVDTSDVREDAVEEVRRAMRELAAFVEANEPRILAYSVHFSDDGRQMTVVHAHVDSASLEYHMDVAGPGFRKLARLVTLSSIRVYGEPSERAMAQLRDKASSLGGGGVIVHRPHAGFGRFADPERGGRAAKEP